MFNGVDVAVWQNVVFADGELIDIVRGRISQRIKGYEDLLLRKDLWNPTL